MMIQLAGNLVGSPDRDIEGDLQDALAPSRLRLWGNRSWPGFGSVGLGLPVPYFSPPWIGVNRYRHYHTHAARWSFGHFLASANQTDQIRDEAFGQDGTDLQPITLEITSPGSKTDEGLEAQVYLMPPVPLFQFEPGSDSTGGSSGGSNSNASNLNGLYLLTVVDQRYFWQWKAVPDMKIADTTTWKQVFQQIGTAIGNTIEPDTVNSAYLNPSRSLNGSYEYLALVLDAACASIGHKLIVGYDGSIKTQAMKTALQAMQQDDDENEDRKILGGGDQFVDTL